MLGDRLPECEARLVWPWLSIGGIQIRGWRCWDTFGMLDRVFDATLRRVSIHWVFEYLNLCNSDF